MGNGQWTSIQSTPSVNPMAPAASHFARTIRRQTAQYVCASRASKRRSHLWHWKVIPRRTVFRTIRIRASVFFYQHPQRFAQAPRNSSIFPLMVRHLVLRSYLGWWCVWHRSGAGTHDGDCVAATRTERTNEFPLSPGRFTGDVKRQRADQNLIAVLDAHGPDLGQLVEGQRRTNPDPDGPAEWCAVISKVEPAYAVSIQSLYPKG